MLNAFKQFFQEFKSFALWKQGLFVAVLLALGSYPLVHAGIIKLPPARAYNCSQITETKSIEVLMQDGKFNPENIQAHVCDKLVFINKDSQPRWPAVGPHPTHTSYPGFDAERGLKQGESFEFVLNRPGHYSFHDHLQDELIGSVTVDKR